MPATVYVSIREIGPQSKSVQPEAHMDTGIHSLKTFHLVYP